MNKAFVSIIVPFYNMELFLEEAVESVIAQTYTNWELLLIDDGSNDGSTAIAKKFAEAMPGKIFYHAHENFINKGLTETRNLGLQNAKGLYTALLDADDVWLPHKLETQVEILNRFPDCALIGGASQYWYSWNENDKEDSIIKVGGRNDELVHPPAFASYLYPLGEGAAPCPCSLIFKTEIAKKHKGFEPQFTGIYQMYEDQAFLIKMYLFEKIYMSSECLDKYRQRSNSLVDSVYETGQYNKVRKFYLEWLKNYVDENNIPDKLVRKKIAEAQMPFTHPVKYKFKKIFNKIFSK